MTTERSISTTEKTAPAAGFRCAARDAFTGGGGHAGKIKKNSQNEVNPTSEKYGDRQFVEYRTRPRALTGLNIHFKLLFTWRVPS
jgi:hypothetical protein